MLLATMLNWKWKITS